MWLLPVFNNPPKEIKITYVFAFVLINKQNEILKHFSRKLIKKRVQDSIIEGF